MHKIQADVIMLAENSFHYFMLLWKTKKACKQKNSPGDCVYIRGYDHCKHADIALGQRLAAEDES